MEGKHTPGPCPHCGYDPNKEQVIRVTISDEDFPVHGAYLSSSAREGKAQIIMDFALHYATAKVCGEEFVPVLSHTATHELSHALQDILGRAFSESDAERIAQAADGIEISSDEAEFRDMIDKGTRIGQELFNALEGLVELYEHGDGCRELPQYLNAKAAIAKAKGD